MRKQFYPNGAARNLSPDANVGICGRKGNTTIHASFSATREYEVDAMIVALIQLRGFLRGNVKPIDRKRSLVKVFEIQRSPKEAE